MRAASASALALRLESWGTPSELFLSVNNVPHYVPHYSKQFHLVNNVPHSQLSGSPWAAVDTARVQPRSLLCYWAVRELGLPGTVVAAKLGLTQPAVSRAVLRGERLAKGGGIPFPRK